MDNKHRPTVKHMEFCSMFMCQSGWERALRENGNMYIHGQVLCCPPETITTLFVNSPYPSTK